MRERKKEGELTSTAVIKAPLFGGDRKPRQAKTEIQNYQIYTNFYNSLKVITIIQIN